MPRIKLEEQASYEFMFPVTLYPRDINYAGHLGNDSLVVIIGSARAEMFHSMGFAEGDLGDGKTGIIMSDLVVNYRAEGFIFDELVIETHIGEIGAGGFRVFYRVTKKGRVLALVETGFVTFDYSIRRLVHVPEIFVKTLKQYQQK
ncbi:MAG: acyl-CoA thioesterase YbgC [Syntrophorhabdus sp. PtaB.Bin184]|nr:MAG: acyl-CoA thioesterase YbgC [Syntrophorhabdus sp. PtaB.Bin184]